MPTLERLRYLCIVASNLDEFFEVRMIDLLETSKSTKSSGNLSRLAELRAVYQHASQLLAEQYRIYNRLLKPALRRSKIAIIAESDLNRAQRQWVSEYFETEVKPLLLPVGMDPAHPLPMVANKSLNFIVQLSTRSGSGRENQIAIVKVPRVIQRIIQIPSALSSGMDNFILISSVIGLHLDRLFPDRQIEAFSQFRVTRHSDLAVDEDEVVNLRRALQQGLRQRQYGKAVRLEVSADCPTALSMFLMDNLKLPIECLYRVDGPVNIGRLSQLLELVQQPKLVFKPFTPCQRIGQGIEGSIFEALKKNDLLLHQPFESFDLVISFLREAVLDPKVLVIKQTIYRTGSDPTLVDLLCEAVRRGKEVTAVVELKARFDEEANINWSERLEASGVQVVYGVVGLKTHAKMLLVTRREGQSFRRYGHLSTGNYNPKTAKLYTDLSHLTADQALTEDMEKIFIHLASQNPLAKLSKLIVAPIQLQSRMLQHIDQCRAAAREGQPAKIVIKCNAMTDPVLMSSLIQAAQEGVSVDLIIRGACMIPAGVTGITERIRVRSIVGRFLEHSRVFYFIAGDQTDLYLSSADWMSRNMLRRIELAWPVECPELKQRIEAECLNGYLGDTKDAWIMDSEGNYSLQDSQRKISVQSQLMHRFS